MHHKDPLLSQAQKLVLENLEIIETTLDECVDDGMLDLESEYHNKLEDLLDSARLANDWDSLIAVISIAKTFEDDIDTWLSFQGRSTVGLEWPTRPNTH
jgi:hypothetical protein